MTKGRKAFLYQNWLRNIKQRSASPRISFPGKRLRWEALKEKALEKKKKQAEEKEQTKEKLRGFLNELNRSEYYQLAVYGTYKNGILVHPYSYYDGNCVHEHTSVKYIVLGIPKKGITKDTLLKIKAIPNGHVEMDGERIPALKFLLYENEEKAFRKASQQMLK